MKTIHNKGKWMNILKLLFAMLFCVLFGAGSLTVHAEDMVAMHRLYYPDSHEHFYTADDNEARILTSERGWVDEGIGWYAPSYSQTPVYRLYNPYSGDHHYTTDKNEYETLGSTGWSMEGVGWYSDDQQRVPVYRQFSPVLITGTHNYTTSAFERDSICDGVNWKDEGIGWYGVKEGKPAEPTPISDPSSKYKQPEIIRAEWFTQNMGNSMCLNYVLQIKNPNANYSILVPKWEILVTNANGRVVKIDGATLYIEADDTFVMPNRVLYDGAGSPPVNVEFKMKKVEDVQFNEKSGRTSYQRDFKFENTYIEMGIPYAGIKGYLSGTIYNETSFDVKQFAIAVVFRKNGEICEIAYKTVTKTLSAGGYYRYFFDYYAPSGCDTVEYYVVPIK